MTTQWFYKVMGEDVGPVSSSELRDQARAGVVTADTFVRQATDENWHVAQSVPGLFDKGARGDATAPEKTPRPDAQPRKQANNRETAEKLCKRIDGALCGIRGEIMDEELSAAQIAQICETLRPIVGQLEDLEANL